MPEGTGAEHAETMANLPARAGLESRYVSGRAQTQRRLGPRQDDPNRDACRDMGVLH